MAELVHKHIDLGHIAQRLEEARIQNPNGSITFNALAADDATAILMSCVRFSHKVPDREQQRIVYHSMFEAGRHGAITKQSLERALNKLEREYFDQPLQPFIIATTISIRAWPWRLSRRMNLDGATITFSPQLPKRFDRSELFEEFPHQFRDPDPTDFSSLRIRVRARSTNEAGEEGFDTIDFLRGMWNFLLNRHTYGRFSSGPPQPVNAIRLGPMHSLHHPNGTVAQQTFWYDPFYSPADPLRVRDDEWKNVDENTAAIRRLIARLPYGDVMREVFIRYARALDTADFEKAFLKLWNLLEVLTDTSASEGYEKTIRRALYIWADVDWQRAVIEHLRTYRNASVHSGFSTDRAEKYVFQLKAFVEELMIFHLTAKPSFQTLRDMAEYFELPRDPAVLRRKIELFDRALRFRGAKRGKKTKLPGS